MAQGTITGSTSNQYIDAKIEWSSVATNASNSSKVTAALYYRRNNTGFTTQGTGTFSITIGGYKTSTSKSLTITENGWVKAVEATITISHDTDGKKSITISSTGSMSGTSLSSTSCSGTVVLDTIPRASTITSAYDRPLGTACSVRWTPLSTSFRYKLTFSLGGWSYTTGAIHPNTTSAYTYTGYTLPLEVANQLPKAKTGTMSVALYTYSNSTATTQVGSASSKTFTVTVPDDTNTKPSITMSLTPVSSLGSTFSSLYIQGKSKVKATLSATGKYGATISSYSMSAQGKSYGSPYQSDFLSTTGSVTVTGTATDSRGYSNTATQSITVIPYSKPSVLPASGEKEIICARCDANGNLSESGTYLKIKAKRSYSKVTASGVQKNFCVIRYRYKAENASSYSAWTTILASSSAGDEVTTNALLGGTLSQTSSYMVQVGVIDDIGESHEVTIRIPTDKVYMHRAGSMNSLGIGKYAEDENMVDIAEDITLKVRGKAIFDGEEWVSLGLSDNVTDSDTNAGRIGTGCSYRVSTGERHVYIAFNCALTYSGNAVTVNAQAIPSAYRPKRNIYAMCATGGRALARILVNSSGNIMIDWIQVISSAEQTNSSTVKWIDGYIDYPI